MSERRRITMFDGDDFDDLDEAFLEIGIWQAIFGRERGDDDYRPLTLLETIVLAILIAGGILVWVAMT